jgi:hypothetical protein
MITDSLIRQTRPEPSSQLLRDRLRRPPSYLGRPPRTLHVATDVAPAPCGSRSRRNWRFCRPAAVPAHLREGCPWAWARPDLRSRRPGQNPSTQLPHPTFTRTRATSPSPAIEQRPTARPECEILHPEALFGFDPARPTRYGEISHPPPTDRTPSIDQRTAGPTGSPIRHLTREPR